MIFYLSGRPNIWLPAPPTGPVIHFEYSLVLNVKHWPKDRHAFCQKKNPRKIRGESKKHCDSDHTHSTVSSSWRSSVVYGKMFTELRLQIAKGDSRQQVLKDMAVWDATCHHLVNIDAGWREINSIKYVPLNYYNLSISIINHSQQKEVGILKCFVKPKKDLYKMVKK